MIHICWLGMCRSGVVAFTHAIAPDLQVLNAPCQAGLMITSYELLSSENVVPIWLFNSPAAVLTALNPLFWSTVR